VQTLRCAEGEEASRRGLSPPGSESSAEQDMQNKKNGNKKVPKMEEPLKKIDP